MSYERLDFTEDEAILKQLSDPLDVEAFSNLMENAHRLGLSAADFVRQEPDRTSRRTIRKLCLKNVRRSLWMQISSSVRSLIGGRPSADPGSHMGSIFGPFPTGRPGVPPATPPGKGDAHPWGPNGTNGTGAGKRS